MESDDTSGRDSCQIQTFDAFDRALAAVVLACDQLSTATWNRDLAHAEIAARAALASWLQARAALQRHEPASAFHGPRWRIAAFALAANRRAISDSLDRTQRMLSEPSLHRVLELLRTTLALASECAHPASPEPAG